MQSNLKTALRFLSKNKMFAGINAFGLAISLAASFIILLYIINEYSFNHCHKNRASVYRVLNFYEDFNMTMAGTPYVLASSLKEQFPQVKKAANTRYLPGLEVRSGNEWIHVNATATDADIFDIFTIPLVMGSPGKHLLEDPGSLVISRDLAEKLFPGQNPVGKEVIAMADYQEHHFNIQGVFENMPKNSTLQAECFINSKWSLNPINKAFGVTNAEKNWNLDFWITWIRLPDESGAKPLEDQFTAFEIRNISDKPHNHYKLQNLRDVYLHSDNVANGGMTGNMKNIRLFFAIALLILLVASINYIILSTAVSTARSREIGIRKTYGARNKNIRSQMLSESVVLTLLVLPFSCILMWLALPYAGRLFKTQLHFLSSNLIIYILVYLILALLIGIASGIYTSLCRGMPGKHHA
jgi:putative ABC transport system permease protein